ncbi:autophagy-related protein 16-1 [Betta splendens]|uniref:Autophagy-related protein 16-1 n=1 Tax=Betta splendens TaxID=158456 RepID=A0A6P7KJI3_BETSP|nr:autophagy-related protein 16-1 [Betta splendens]
MASWKSHVRARLQLRDHTEKRPFVGVFSSLSQLEERFEARKQFLGEVKSESQERGAVDVAINTRLLQLQLKESEHFADKLSQTVSDLTSVLYVKEAEVQYWQSRVSQYREEALTLAKGSNGLKATLAQLDFTIECQAKELGALRAERDRVQAELAQARREKDELLQRWMEDKREEADRLNNYNDIQERWQRLTQQLRKHLHKEAKAHVPTVASGATAADAPRSHQDICSVK